MRWVVAGVEFLLLGWFLGVGLEAIMQRANRMRSPFHLAEFHHAHLGAALVALGFALDSVTGVFVQLLGIVVTADDLYQHIEQTCGDNPTYRSPLHELFAATVWKVPGIPAVVRILDRWWGAIAAAAALVAILACAQPLAGQVPTDTLHASFTVRLVFPDSVLRQLDSIAGSDVERVRCLVGVAGGVTMYVDMVHEPRIVRADKDSVLAGRCPAATIVEWHTHPPESTLPTVKWCYLSGMDLGRVLASHAWIFMVHVRRGVYCWWSRPQIERELEANPHLRQLDPIKGQSSWGRAAP